MSEELKKYVNLFASMCVDCLMGGITIGTFIANAEIMIEKMRKIHAADERSEG